MIPVLYEDSASSGKVKNFGLHVLVLACLRDVGVDAVVLGRLLDPRPKKGIHKVLSDLDRDLGPKLIIVADGDRIAQALGLPSSSLPSCADAIEKRYKHGVAKVFLLERNLETILEVLRDCQNDPPGRREQFEAALKKNLNARDILLQNTTRADRDCVQKRMPSFAALVDGIRVLVTS